MPEHEAHGEYIGVAKFSTSSAAKLREHYHRVRREFAGRIVKIRVANQMGSKRQSWEALGGSRCGRAPARSGRGSEQDEPGPK